MSRISIGLLLAGVIAFVPALASADEIAASADAFRDGNAPITNYGSAKQLRIRRSGDRVVLIRFDASQFPADFQPPALLKLHVDDVNVPGRIEVLQLLSDWQEQSVTFNTRPLFSSTVEATYDVSRTDKGQTITLDVTKLVSAWYANPSRNFGLAVAAGATSSRPAQVQFASREATPGPMLVVSGTAVSANTGAPAVAVAAAGPAGDPASDNR